MIPTIHLLLHIPRMVLWMWQWMWMWMWTKGWIKLSTCPWPVGLSCQASGFCGTGRQGGKKIDLVFIKKTPFQKKEKIKNVKKKLLQKQYKKLKKGRRKNRKSSHIDQRSYPQKLKLKYPIPEKCQNCQLSEVSWKTVRAYGRHWISQPMRIVGPIQFWEITWFVSLKKNIYLF